MEKHPRVIKKAAVLGAGVMGSGIAAHLANAGIPSLLLDIVPDDAQGSSDPLIRNRLSNLGKTKALEARPAAFYTKKSSSLITTGNIDDDLGRIADADWIIEVAVENLKIKQDLFKKVEKFWRPGTIVSSNTSGISITGMTDRLSPEFKQHFLVTHFFNPVRYMKLLEIVPGSDTDKNIVSMMADFGRDVLGKGVVFGKDTPNFIANRIGIYSAMLAIKTMIAGEYTIEEIDAIAGPPMGRPKSAAFRTADIVGLDTFIHVAKNVYDSLPNDECRDVFSVPDFMNEMVKRGMLGDKTKKGFYQKVGSEIGALDCKTLEYRPQVKPKFESLSEVKSIEDTGERIKALISKNDKAGQFAWKVLSGTLIYSANRIPEIADDVVNIDNGLKWGFNWELGPFETWDAIGVKESVERMEKEGQKIPPSVRKMLAGKKTSFYRKKPGKTSYFDLRSGRYTAVPMDKRIILLGSLKDRKKSIKENTGATLIDMGDNVACLEFHTKMNSIDADIITMVHDSLDEVRKNFRGLVIGNQGEAFSAGANILLLLMESENKNWDAIAKIVKEFQDANMALKYFEKPVVAAPFGMALGGGCEVCMSAGRNVALAETYIGLVEVGVGLIPGGGGTKEMLLRNMEGIGEDVVIDPFPFVRKAFETMALAKVSTSAEEARDLKFLRAHDRIVLNKDYLLHEAKNTVIGMAVEGWKPPLPAKIRVPGEAGRSTLELFLYTMKMGGYASEHDETIGKKLAFVMTGGNVSSGSMVTEQYILDLEREAFVSLCGYEKTRERMKQMLMTGRPLRN